MSKNAIARLGCMGVVLLLLATVATSVAESTPSDDSSSNGRVIWSENPAIVI